MNIKDKFYLIAKSNSSLCEWYNTHTPPHKYDRLITRSTEAYGRKMQAHKNPRLMSCKLGREREEAVVAPESPAIRNPRLVGPLPQNLPPYHTRAPTNRPRPSGTS